MAERSDARRNRERLLETAAAAFAVGDGPVSLEAVARGAGVGIGTLYRHFPTREALIEAVYRAELADVSASAAQLLNEHPPADALRRWMDRYAEFVAAKRGMAESLRAIFESGAVERNETRARHRRRRRLAPDGRGGRRKSARRRASRRCGHEPAGHLPGQRLT